MCDCIYRGDDVLWWHVHKFLACQENACLTFGPLSVHEILVTMMKMLRILKDPKRTLL